ncbi:hypothetical protein FJY70_01910, partial [candidate division WOR-3 bacterium]|nr:hypothetical protein [candidate division WOR-3 bacterium]
MLSNKPSAGIGATYLLALVAVLFAASALAVEYVTLEDGTVTVRAGSPPKPVLIPIDNSPHVTPGPADVNYTSAQNGRWGDTLTWSPRGVPGSSDNVTINHTVNPSGTQAVLSITIGSGGALVDSGGANSLTVNGDWTNNGTVTLTGSTVTFSGSSAAVIGGTNPTTFYQLYLSKDSLARTVTMNAAVTVSANTNTALQITTGTLTTNGRNLTVNGGTSSRVVGSTAGKLVINNGSTANIYYMYQWGLGYVVIAGDSTVVNITNKWDLANSGHRVDISSGTVNINSTVSGSLTLYTNNSGWGWFMTGGTLNLYGPITTNIAVFFVATGTSATRFVGSTSATASLHSGSSNSNRWSFNQLFIEKTGGATVTFTTSSGPVGGFVTALNGLTVNSGTGITLGGWFKTDSGYLFGSVTNNGTITMNNDTAGNRARPLNIVTGTFTNNGTFTLGPRRLAIGTATT